MDNTLQKETARLKKEFIKANKEADKCTIKKCKHIKNIKNITAKLKKCNKEVLYRAILLLFEQNVCCFNYIK